MGSRSNTFSREKAEGNYAANSAEFKQAQKQYQSKAKFGQTSTRSGGLSQEEIGDAPTMKYSKGLLGAFERAQDPEYRKRLGFGGNAQLG